MTLASFFSSNVVGASASLTNLPLVSMSTKVVRPNVMFILDDSTSMNSEYMPDGINSNSSRPCYKNFGYNTIYFNPNIDYDLPVQSTGVDYAYTPTIGSARDNGYDSASSTVNLSSTTTTTTYSSTNVSIGTTASFNTTISSRLVKVTRTSHGLNTGDYIRITGTPTSSNLNNIPWTNITWTSGNPQIFQVTRLDANNFTFTANGSTNASSTGSRAGASGYNFALATPVTTGNYVYYTHATNPSSCDTDGNYTKVEIISRGATEQQNFANWYSFYRTRLLMMKSASGRAFVGVGDNFRVGFTTINEKGTTAARWLGVSKFDSTQKSSWYSKLYGQNITGIQYTPLRGALSKAGRYYAGNLVAGASDPVQYSCQKNFSILTTDGYWNKAGETATYGPKRENNTTDVGDQDSVLATSPRPMYDAGAYSNTLADIARYYWKTDLRTSSTVGGMRDDSIQSRVDANIQDKDGVDLPDGHQHMNTLTLGLGMSGDLTWPDDTDALKDGTVDWPDPQTGVSGDTVGIPARLDDLWHAAYNGGGIYASASNPQGVVSALTNALSNIVDTEKSGAAAATSSLEPVTGDNYAYIAQYKTGRWTGDLEAHTIDVDPVSATYGEISTVSNWSAQDLLDGRVTATTDTRTLYTWNAAGTARVDFTPANVNTGVFPTNTLSQYLSWDSFQRANATADNLINYLRGRHEFEARTDASHSDYKKQLFRVREHVLGDIVDSSPVFVKKPPFRYADPGYASFVGSNSTRAGTVYVGSNDGMLHAINSDTGAERWAYIPRMLHSELYKLADSNYANLHQYYVNGTITVGDAYDGSTWRTILIAGLGNGGRGYFALDVTDPTNPSVLWEYTNGNLGKSFGNPILTKRDTDGQWVVLFASGYNNESPGDGKGRLFVVNAFTGADIGSIPTAAGTDPNLSGIAKVTNWVLDTMVNNNTQYVYGGDLAGNLWRFDINDLSVTATAQLLGTTSATPGYRPITARPEVSRIRDSVGTYHRVVYVGTGRYLGAADLDGSTGHQTTQQMLLAVKDTGGSVGVMTTALVAQTLLDSVTPRTIPSPLPVDWTTDKGWYVLIPSGERVNIEPRLQLGTVSFVANKPVDDYCVLGGSSWLYALDYKSGGAITTVTTNVTGLKVDAKTIGTGLTIVRLPDGTLVAIVNTPEGTRTLELPINAAGAGSVRRVGYREIN